MLYPQAYVLPSLPIASEWNAPAAIEPNFTPSGAGTKVGTSASVVESIPNCPTPLYPQAYALSSVPSANEWLSPAATETNLTPSGAFTRLGISALLVESMPNCPAPLNPQAYVWPLEPNAKE